MIKKANVLKHNTNCKQSIINRYKLTLNSIDFVAMVAFATDYNGEGIVIGEYIK